MTSGESIKGHRVSTMYFPNGDATIVGPTDQGHGRRVEASWLQLLSARADEGMIDQRVKMFVARPGPLHPQQPMSHHSIAEELEAKGRRQKRAEACGGRGKDC